MLPKTQRSCEHKSALSGTDGDCKAVKTAGRQPASSTTLASSLDPPTGSPPKLPPAVSQPSQHSAETAMEEGRQMLRF